VPSNSSLVEYGVQSINQSIIVCNFCVDCIFIFLRPQVLCKSQRLRTRDQVRDTVCILSEITELQQLSRFDPRIGNN
jgi:hypothetical protein